MFVIYFKGQTVIGPFETNQAARDYLEREVGFWWPKSVFEIWAVEPPTHNERGFFGKKEGF